MPTLFKAQNGVIGLWAAGTLKPGALPAERTYRRTVFATMPTIFCRKHKESPGGERRRALLRQDDGFTMIEALVATVILIVGLIGLLGLLDASVKASASTRAREGATSLAREIIEDARTIPYAQIIPTSIESQLQAMNGLTNATPGSGWHIERRGFSYTVAVKECAIDDPKDGLAKTHGSTFCEGQQEWKAGEAVDTAPENLKRITAEVSWSFKGRTSTVKQVSTLTAAGQAIGLLASKLELTGPAGFLGTATTPVVTDKETKALTFSVSFPEGTSAIDWSLEGAKQEELTPASKATSLTFSWPINEPPAHPYVSDGTYQVAAQAVDATGVIGPPISIPVRLIRGVPLAPGGIVGGFNTVFKNGLPTEVAEFQWKANAERNVIGYRVYGPAKELICPFESPEALSTTTSCIDFHLLATKPSERSYTVVALYRNAGEEVKESPAGSITIKRAESTAPNAPTNLVPKKNADGSVTLKWKASEPKIGVELSFYRIYRGSTNYTSRYDETPAECPKGECSYTDTEATTTHEYWVTAVSSHLTESTPPLGPVIE
jgi:type II secretory pathway pseudopilin PulG